jgi:hypothetical protein
MRFLQLSAIVLLVCGTVVLACFVGKATIDGYTIFSFNPTDYPTTGQFGDFVGGVVGTFFALSGTLLIYMNFKEQTRENKRSAFESSFFEMLKLYRENVSEFRYKKFMGGEYDMYENRQVARLIFEEFIECYREIRKYSNSKNELDYLHPVYAKKIRSIAVKQNPEIDIIEMASIDLAFLIVFFGLGEEGEAIIKANIINKFSKDYYYKLIYFIKLKPKRSNASRFESWERLNQLTYENFHKVIEDLYQARKQPSQPKSSFPLVQDFDMGKAYNKYYGGHQFRLGHYFRHLYQSYTYLNDHPDLSEKEKYSYGKLYRAQLSTYEQALLLVNSISSLGMKWEFQADVSDLAGVSSNLITKYNLIKNLPGGHLSGIRYKTYYPDVSYENEF